MLNRIIIIFCEQWSDRHNYSSLFYRNSLDQYFYKKINDIVKLVGTTIVCLPQWDAGGYGPKVEGFFYGR